MTCGTKKALFHGFMAVAAALEYRSSAAPFRKHLCGAWLGFHLACVADDIREHLAETRNSVLGTRYSA
ncbi:MAG: hypothetical protein M3P27_02870 [Acidobacteriota bacterium]|nr:hypothetical protein [Acidobacteriota bacterium]